MSLLFGGATSDRVDHGNTGTDPTAATVYGWFYPTAYTTTRRMFQKISAGAAGYWSFNYPGGGTNRLRISVDYSVADADAQSADNAFQLNQWNFWAAVFDGTNAPKLYVGTLVSTAAEVSYTGTPTAPSGSRVTDGGAPVMVGNANNTLTSAFPGRIALINWIPGSALSLAELQSHQFRPRSHANSKIFTHYGFAGTGTQPDWSGNGNNGTVTGATVADHVPLGPPFGWDVQRVYSVPAPAGGGGWLVGGALINRRGLVAA